MIINNIPDDLCENFKYDTYLFSNDSLFIYWFYTSLDNAFRIWVYDVMKNKISKYAPEVNLKKMLIKTFESQVPTPTAHFVNEDIIILLFDECDKALLQTIKLNLSRGRISSVDSLLINDIHNPVLLKEGTNFGIAFTHIVQNKNEDYHIPDDEFAAYYHIRQENGFFFPLNDRIIFNYKYQEQYDNFQSPHLYDNKLWFFRGLLKEPSGPCTACMRRSGHIVKKDDEPYVSRMQLSYFDLTKRSPRELKFMVIENINSVLWQKNLLYMLEYEEEVICSIFDLTNKTLVHFKDTNELLKFGSIAKKYIFEWGDRYIDPNSNVTMIDIRKKRQLLRVPFDQNSTQIEEAQCLINKALVRIVL